MNNDETKTVDEQFVEDYRVAVHEHGHFFACLSSFGICASPSVFAEAEKYNTSNGERIAGVCQLDIFATATPFQKSVIGWSGYLAEHTCGVAHPLIANPFPLRETTLREFWSASEVGFEKKFSLADQQLICCYKNRFNSFVGSYRRIIEVRAKIKRLARHTANEKLAERREFEAQKKAAAAWAKNPPRMSTAARAEHLENFLRNLPADAPERAKFETMLDYLKRGQEPPAELEKP